MAEDFASSKHTHWKNLFCKSLQPKSPISTNSTGSSNDVLNLLALCSGAMENSFSISGTRFGWWVAVCGTGTALRGRIRVCPAKRGTISSPQYRTSFERRTRQLLFLPLRKVISAMRQTTKPANRLFYPLRRAPEGALGFVRICCQCSTCNVDVLWSLQHGIFIVDAVSDGIFVAYVLNGTCSRPFIAFGDWYAVWLPGGCMARVGNCGCA